MTDLLAGQVHVMFDNVPTSLQYIRAGKLRALAVTSSTRSELLPDLPTVGDFLPGYEATAWYGLGAPTGTPPDIIDKLNKTTNAILADPKSTSGRARARLTNAASISPIELALKTWICKPMARAAVSTSRSVVWVLPALSGLTSTPTRTATPTPTASH